MNLSPFFHARSIVIVGASRDPKKVGHVIFRNLLDSEFDGEIFLVNRNAGEILNHKVYRSVGVLPSRPELAIIAVPAPYVLKIIEDCGKKKIKHVIIVSAGFREVGNVKLEERLARALKQHNILCIGPNCLGTFDAHSGFDSLFIPQYRMKRPKAGGIAFVSQSGAVGSTILDLAAEDGYGFSKFISYGNAVNVDESDLLSYLGSDKQTRVICLYIEGLCNGRKFLETAKEVSKKKPVIVIKGGLHESSSQATLSHTGSLAGDKEVYFAAFRQAGVLYASSLDEMFYYAKIFEYSTSPSGSRVQIITNGGGFGIICADAVLSAGLLLAHMHKDNCRALEKALPKIVTIKNPIDLAGDATTERYRIAIEYALRDENVDMVIVILLYQTPLITADIIDVLVEASEEGKKPLVVVSAGGEFTHILKENLEEHGVPCYTFPEQAAIALRGLIQYYSRAK
ncbi:CoA-binding protein [Candidatus Woesearchaeota archaeon]|nr:CoA-binding protein [Candidatus Woesearchaeota archaeon]